MFRRLFASLIAAYIALAVPAATHAQTSDRKWVAKPTVASPVAEQKRLALIIGNTAYGGGNSLKNPANDAKAVAAALAKLGFASTVLLDGTRNEMRDVVHEFAAQIKAAGSQSVALLYYSGHGLQIDGENYLVPIGFTMPEHRTDIDDYALSAQKALDEMQGAKAQVNIAILDACRNNPYEGSKAMGSRGLAKIEAQGMLIAYATAAGRTADDNTAGANGLYTASLLKYLQTPGLRLGEIFKKTNKAVYEASKHEQLPYLYDGLLDDDAFYLLPQTAAPEPIAVVGGTAAEMNTKARLQVTCNAPGFTVSIAGNVVDDIYVANLLDEETTTVNVKVTAPGYEGKIVRATLERGKTLPLSVTLDAMVASAPKPAANTNAPRPNSAASRTQPEYRRGIEAYSKKEYGTAFPLLEPFATAGDADAQIYLGVMYEFGLGVTKDLKEAVRLYKLAANQGNAVAQNNLGTTYNHGKGVAKNLMEAVRLYKLSAKQGGEFAKDNLKRLGQSMPE